LGLFDLPAPLFGAVDGVLALALPAFIRLLLWGVLAGWITMLAYRRLSNQEKISVLKAQQKVQQKEISEFDGEFEELMPLVRHTLAIGFRQLGLALGPALLATIPVLFVVIWVAGQFGHEAPAAGEKIILTALPAAGPEMRWDPPERSTSVDGGWELNWPQADQPLRLLQGNEALLTLPLEHNVPVIHQKQWWNVFMANPIGYLPQGLETEVINIELPEQQILAFGPDWMRGWMFSFFLMFLISSIAFKFILRIH
jgi:hypothetical protein